MAVLLMIIYALVSFSLTAFLLILLKKKITSDKQMFWAMRIGMIVTLLIHYSDFFITLIKTGNVEPTFNGLFIIYPCNLVMWLCVVMCFFRSTKSPVFKIISEFVSFAGIACLFFGIIFNTNYYNNPDLTDSFIFKGLLSHNTNMFVALIPLVFGKVKLSSLRNTFSCLAGAVLMLICGVYLRLVDLLYEVPASEFNDAMFVFAVPFPEKYPWLSFPVFVLIGVVFFFGLFNLIEVLVVEKEKRWYKQPHLGLTYKE